MKKFFMYMALLISVMMILACKTTSGANSGPIITQEETDNAFRDIYNEYRRDIILDGAKEYTVKNGDRLSAISRNEYNNGFYFPLIMLASNDVVLDPDKIEPGMKLIIPDLQRNLNNAKARGNIKQFLGEVAGLYDRRSGRTDDAAGLRQLADSL